MNKLSLALNVVLAAAVIGIYVLHFNSTKQVESEVQEISNKTEELEKEPKVEINEEIEVVEVYEADTVLVEETVINKIESSTAYIDLDVLSTEWSYFVREGKKIEDRRMNREQYLRQQYQTLMTDAQNYELSVQNGTSLRDMSKEQNFINEQQQIEAAIQKVMSETQSDVFSVNTKGMKRMQQVLKDYAKKNGFKHIFSVGQGSGPAVIYSDETLDVTKPILKILNTKYK